MFKDEPHQCADALRLTYPELSRRLLLDFAERIMKASADDASTPYRDLVRAQEKRAREDSVAFRRGLGGRGLHEYIFIAKNEAVKTPIATLAKLLEEGLASVSREEGDDVVHEEYDRDSFKREPHSEVDEKTEVDEKNRIHLVYQSDGDYDLAASSAHFDKIVYVTLAGLTIPQDKLRSLLLPGLVVGEGKNEEAHFCSFIPTIITPMPDPRIGPIQTEELDEHHRHHRLHRDATILSACREHADRLPESPAAIQINRWGRNVANRQIGFTTSGGGACAYRTIAILDELAAAGIPVDVFGGLSGGAVIGAYYAGDECGGLHTVLARGKEFGKVVPALMISTKPMEAIVDKDFSYQRVGDTSVRFFAVTTELREGKPPRADIVTGGTLGQAVRVSGSLPLGFAPTVIDGKRFADGMASAIVPTYVAINHGADVTMACNCVPGPNSTNPFSSSWLGRMLYNDTPLGRLIDYSTWVFFLTQNASTAYGQGSDVFFQFDPERITTLESMHWGEAYAIYGKAKTERKRIKKAVDELKECWEALA